MAGKGIVIGREDPVVGTVEFDNVARPAFSDKRDGNDEEKYALIKLRSEPVMACTTLSFSRYCKEFESGRVSR